MKLDDFRRNLEAADARIILCLSAALALKIS